MRIKTAFFAFLALVLLSFLTFASGDDVVLSRVEDLRPTQSRLGLQEVQRKAQRIAKLSRSERHVYLLENPIPVVIGPRGQFYVVDHHHLARAVYEAGHSKLYVSVIADKSNLTEDQFWDYMKRKNWVYLKDQVKDTTLTPRQLPVRIEEMKDDPFRALAGQLRRAGGFVKSEGSYFIEFRWSEKLRDYFKRKGFVVRSQWRQKDLNQALKFAFSAEARQLPGNRLQLKCEKVYARIQ